MPLVRISLQVGSEPSFRTKIGDAVHQAMIDTINVPAADHFQLFSEHAPDQFVYDPSYLNIERTDGLVMIQITLNAGRTVEQKKALYARLAALLSERAGVRPQDVLVNLVEVPRENWSFGNGLAPYAP
jgi:phenylpyruvate tautomerase PptA (4-oxalocrotonate tautomerase family)